MSIKDVNESTKYARVIDIASSHYGSIGLAISTITGFYKVCFVKGDSSPLYYRREQLEFI